MDPNCQTYPTLGILDPSLELNKLSESTDKQAHEAFSMRYVLDTELKTMEDMHHVLVLFKLHATDVRNNAEFKDKIKELESLKERVTAPIEVIGEFYCRLVDLYRTGRRVFYVRLADKKTVDMVDLDERDVRFITITECGVCHKKKPEPLFECVKCRKAAYCGAECQKKDWSFHKRFCPLFITQGEGAKRVVTVVSSPEQPFDLRYDVASSTTTTKEADK